MDTGHFKAIVSIYFLVIYQVYAFCNSASNEHVNNRADYISRPLESEDSALFQTFNDIINSCYLGKFHRIFDRNACFDHCTLRGWNCVGVESSPDGCRFCLSAEYDENRHENADFNHLYVNRTALTQVAAEDIQGELSI